MNNIHIYIDIANKNVAIFSIFFVEGPPLHDVYQNWVLQFHGCTELYLAPHRVKAALCVVSDNW